MVRNHSERGRGLQFYSIRQQYNNLIKQNLMTVVHYCYYGTQMDPTHCLKIYNIDTLLQITTGIEAQCESVNQTMDKVQLDSHKNKTIKFQ